jgi:predicted nucleic acid-binding Zn ribbon protein
MTCPYSVCTVCVFVSEQASERASERAREREREKKRERESLFVIFFFRVHPTNIGRAHWSRVYQSS